MPMASLSSPLLAAAAFSLILLSFANASNDLCEKVRHPDLCRSLLPSEHEFTSPTDLTIFTIKKTIVQVNKGIETIKAKMGDDKTGIVAVCEEVYGNAVDELEKVMKDLEGSGLHGSVVYSASAVISYLETCKDGFVEAGKEFIFEDMNNKLENMASNVLSLARIVTNS